MKVIATVVGITLLITQFSSVVKCQESSEDNDMEKLRQNYIACPGGYCVHAYLCINGSIVTDGDDIIEMRGGFAYAPSGTYEKGATPIRFGPMEVDPDDSDDPCEDFFLKCCAVSQPACGTSHPNGYVFKVKKPSMAQFGEFPWMAALLQRKTLIDKKIFQYFCGGSLIDPQVILTAAHCVKDYTNALDTLVVRLGEWDTWTEHEPLKHEQIGVRKLILHEKFVDKIYHNDLALLILERPANLNVHINPICLPSPGDNFDNQRCLVSGWGKENLKPDGKYSEVLKKIELPVVSHKQCRKMLRATKLGRFFHLHKSFMCAGGEAGVGGCKGDGGSPLACKRDDDSYVQAGIVAWGIGCGETNVPGAYVKVSNFVKWIQNKMDKEGL